MKFYKCPECENIIITLNDNNQEIKCCDKKMEELIPNTNDGAVEKHVPICKKVEGTNQIIVGETMHPMQDEHYITFIAQEQDNKINIIKLKPNNEPIANLPYLKDAKVYSYCNKHGLWSNK